MPGAGGLHQRVLFPAWARPLGARASGRGADGADRRTARRVGRGVRRAAHSGGSEGGGGGHEPQAGCAADGRGRDCGRDEAQVQAHHKAGQQGRTRPDRLWVADATYIPTLEGFLSLAVVLDVFSRRIVGWSMGQRPVAGLMTGALDMAVSRRDARGAVHHSDRGSQYTSAAFGSRCRAGGVSISMGSVGDIYDNVMCESFFATLECELIGRHRFQTRDEAGLAVFEFIDGFRNRRRRHSSISHVSPVVFVERQAVAFDQKEAA